jgi:phospholipase C
MWPVVRQVVDSLRHDDANPIHALDGWLLRAIETAPPLPIQGLAQSFEMRMGPGHKGPELAPAHVRLWVRDATERELIEARTATILGAPSWHVTTRGTERLRALRGPTRYLGGAVAFVARLPTVWAGAVERLREQDEVRTGQQPPARLDLPKIRRSPGDDEGITPEQARANLERIEHIVVLMMENRSFDHMLGYLDLVDGQEEVGGLRHAKPITYDGHAWSPAYLLDTAFPKSMDPPHGKKEIARQIRGGEMDGFVESFARANDVADAGRVMGYYTHRELPVYDYFAHKFLLCDRWFSSAPSATWANRVFAVTGSCDPAREGLFDGGERFYDRESFVRLLRDDEDPNTWRWYSWDPGSLRFIDDRYRLNPGKGFHHDHFRRVAQHSIEPNLGTEAGEHEVELGPGLLQDAANGDLPKVAWIDPNFVDLSILEPNSNDDHPPSDVRSGQELAMMVFRALAQSPCWDRTLLVVTYDEHGGFYDHQPPPRPPEPDPPFETLGVRVPAFLVSPFVEPCTVSHRQLDHTSITRTILERFGVDGAVGRMAERSPRVGEVDHLGYLLTRDPGTDTAPPDYAYASAALGDWRHVRAERRSAASPQMVRAPGARWEPEQLTELPAEFLDAARALRDAGLPAGHP